MLTTSVHCVPPVSTVLQSQLHSERSIHEHSSKRQEQTISFKQCQLVSVSTRNQQVHIGLVSVLQGWRAYRVSKHDALFHSSYYRGQHAQSGTVKSSLKGSLDTIAHVHKTACTKWHYGQQPERLT